MRPAFPPKYLASGVLPKSSTDMRSRGAKKANRTKWAKPIQPVVLNWGKK